MNAGGLAIAEYFISTQMIGPAMVAAIIAAAVAMGPLAIVQLITGISCLFGPARSLTPIGALLSMLPLSPVWIISCPTGIWACLGFKRGKRTPVSVALPNKNSWGATTLMFIRESRWATTTGMFNVAAGVMLIAALAAFRYGYYPAEMHYRVVDTNQKDESLYRAVQDRLQLSEGFRGVGYDRHSQPSMLTVRTWRYCRGQIKERLSVQDAPHLVWLPAPTDLAKVEIDGAETVSRWPVGAMPPGHDLLRAAGHHLGTATRVGDNAFELSSTFVGKVSSPFPTQLIVELTPNGREQLANGGGEDLVAIGLVVGGIVEGIAPTESVSQRQMVFHLAPSSNLTSAALRAGIRGPVLPSQLELLD
jgi:hypothetical protein